MRKTNIFEKTFASIINILIVILIYTPIYFLISSLLYKKIILIMIFFIYALIFAMSNKGRDFGMIIIGTYWKENYPLKNHIIYSILYTLSFSTLFFHFYFPFDLFLFNLMFLQLPLIAISGTTLHGYLSGKMVTVKPNKF